MTASSGMSTFASGVEEPPQPMVSPPNAPSVRARKNESRFKAKFSKMDSDDVHRRRLRHRDGTGNKRGASLIEGFVKPAIADAG